MILFAFLCKCKNSVSLNFESNCPKSSEKSACSVNNMNRNFQELVVISFNYCARSGLFVWTPEIVLKDVDLYWEAGTSLQHRFFFFFFVF